VIGVAFQGLQQANSTGYVIPMPVIRHFLKDIQDGRYDGYVEIGARFMPMENKALRRHYGLTDNALGCMVSDVVKGSACDGPLKVGDVVMAVNGLPVDASAMIELEGVRVRLEELAERSFAGDKVHFTLLRDGDVTEAEVTLAALPSIRVLSRRYDEQPRYVVFGGLVFQPLEYNVVQAHQVPSSAVMVELDRFTRGGESAVKQDLVLMTRTLPDEVNARFDEPGRSLVTKVNGVEVKGLEHLYSLLYPAEGEERPAYTVIELADAPRPMVIDNTTVDAANKRISERYNIPAPARLK
jgi:S1-C subfamily serine protease